MRMKMIVTVSEFDTYTNHYEDDPKVVEMKKQMLLAAQEVVADYIGFKLESETRTDYISGIGNNHLFLFAYPITGVTSVEVNGSLVTDYTIYRSRYLIKTEGVWAEGVNNIKVTYTAGWTPEDTPSTIRMTILQIASLLLEEANGNIGVTGKSFAENSRSFINYTNYDKWLKKLDPFRILRLY